MSPELSMLLNTNIGNFTLKDFAAGKQAHCVRLDAYAERKGDFILKTAGEGKAYTQEEAELLVEQTKLYREELIEAGVKLPQNYALETFESDGEWRIMMVDQFLGNGMDGKKLLSSPNVSTAEKAYCLTSMFIFLRDLPDGDKHFTTKVMGDFKPDNFVMADGNLYFIDYFAPKRFGEDGKLTPYLNPKIDTFSRQGIKFLCGDRRGQAARMLALINRDHKDLIDVAQGTFRFLYADKPQVLEYVNGQIESNYQKIDAVYKTKERNTLTTTI